MVILSIIIVAYAVIGATTILILRMLARRWRRLDVPDSAIPSRPPALADKPASQAEA
jgi:hypothetical protein